MQEEGSGRAGIQRASPQLFLSSLSLEGRKHRDLGLRTYGCPPRFPWGPQGGGPLVPGL